MTQIKVYVTSKREHAEKILENVPDGFHLNARWPYMMHTKERPVTHWLRENFDDAIASHFVIFYVEPGDRLKSSLIEVGNALAYGKKVFIASDKFLPEGEAVLAHYMPHKDLIPWVGFTDQIKISGTLAQTYSRIKHIVAQQRIVRSDGSLEERK